MLAKLTAKNQITLPKAIARCFPSAEYFDVQMEDHRIILTPVALGQADRVRDKLAALGITEDDVQAAVQWARQ
jgi:hypothetical protein